MTMLGLLEDYAPSRFFKFIAQLSSLGVYDRAKCYLHHETGVMEPMNAKLKVKKWAVYGIYIT